MKNRKFRGDRLIKIIKIIVNSVTVFTLFFGTMAVLNQSEIKRYKEEFWECTKKGGTMSSCGIYLDMAAEEKKLTYLYLKIGFGLPIIFYGGLKFYNYIFPKTNWEK